MSNEALLPKEPDKYTMNREKNKNNVVVGSILFTKSAIGLGLLSNSYFFTQTGAILGCVTTLVLCFLITYTLSLLLALAEKIEAKNKELKMENLDMVSLFVFGFKMQMLSKTLNFLFNYCCIVVNMINFCKYAQQIIALHTPWTSIRLFEVKIIVIVFILFILVFILEPEKLRYPSYIALFVLLLSLVSFWIINCYKYAHLEHRPEVPLFVLAGINNFIGNQLYAMESIGTLFTVRSTLKKRSEMQKVLLVSFGTILVLFLINGMSFILTYGSKDIQKMPFSNFNNQYIRVLEVLFYFSFPATVTIFIISNCYEFEFLPWVKSLLANDKKEMHLGKLYAWRATLATMMLASSFFFSDEFALTVVSGIIVVPIIGFLIPMILDMKFHYKEWSKAKLCFKMGVVLLAMVVNGFCIYGTLRNK